MHLPRPGEIFLKDALEHSPVRKLLTSFPVPRVVAPFSVVHMHAIPTDVYAQAMPTAIFPAAFVQTSVSPREAAAPVVDSSSKQADVA